MGKSPVEVSDALKHGPSEVDRQEGTSSSVPYEEVSFGMDASPGCILDQAAPARQLIDVVGSKWALLCLYALDDGSARFNALERRLVGVTQKMLSETLRKLERAGLISRTIYPEVPPRVEYKLTTLGASLRPVTSAICHWSQEHAGKLKT